MPFTLRDENTTDNPPLATVYGKQITAGKLVYFYKEAGRHKCILFLGDGEMDGIDKLYYNGEVVPEFTDSTSTVRNWKFHPGAKTSQPVFRDVTALTTDTLTLTGAYFNVGDEVALVAGVDPAATGIYPTGVIQHQKLYVVYASGNDIKLSLTAGGTVLSGWPTSGSYNSYLLTNLKVYKANAGYFDPVQGRPEFFSSPTAETQPLNFTFSEITYVEVWLNETQTQVEDTPESFKIFVRGRKLQNYDENGLVADAAGVAYPDQNNLPAQTKFFSANNALVAVDIMLNYMKISHDRINWASFVKFRDYCQETISWNSGTDSVLASPNFGGLTDATFTGLTNVLENPTGTFQKTTPTTGYDAAAISTQTVADNAPKISISEMFMQGNHTFGLSKVTATNLDPNSAVYTIRTTAGYNPVNGQPTSTTNSVFSVYRYGVLLYESGSLDAEYDEDLHRWFYIFNGTYALNGDSFKIETDGSDIVFFRNNVEFFRTVKDFNVADTNPLRSAFFFAKPTSKVKDLKFFYTQGTINVTESPVGTFVKANPTNNVYDAAGLTKESAAYNTDKIEVDFVWRGGTVQVGLSQLLSTDTDVNKQDPTKSTYNIHIDGTNGRVYVKRLGVNVYSSVTDNVVSVGDLLKIILSTENGTIDFYKNNVKFYTETPNLNGTNPVKGSFFLYNDISNISDYKYYPVGGTSRSVQRFDAHVVFPSEIAATTALEQVMGRAPGCHWQDVDGKVKFIVGSHYKNLLTGEVPTAGDRVLYKLISFDPTQTEVKCNIVEDSFSSYKRPIDQKQNFVRTEFRDLEDEYFTKKYTFGDRPSLRDYVGILVDQGIVQIGVATQSLADRLTEAILRWNTDLDLFVTFKGMADTFALAKGDLVKFAHDVPGWRNSNAPLFVVLDETFENDTADERSFTLQIYDPRFYSDTAHGAINPSFPASPPEVLKAPESLNYDYDGVKLKFYWDRSETTNVGRYRLTDEFDRVIAETVNLYYTETNPSVNVITRRVYTIDNKDQVSSDYATVTFVRPPKLEWTDLNGVVVNSNAEKTLSTTPAGPTIKYATMKTAVIVTNGINTILSFKPNATNVAQGMCLNPTRFSFGSTYYGLWFNANGTMGEFLGSTNTSFGRYQVGDEYQIRITGNRVTYYRIRGSRVTKLVGVGGSFGTIVPEGSILYARAYTNVHPTTINLSPVLTGNLTENLESTPVAASNIVNASYNASLGKATRTGGTAWGTSGLSFVGVPSNRNGGFYLDAVGGILTNDASGIAIGLTNSDTGQDLASMPFYFIIDSSGYINYYSGNTLLHTDTTPSYSIGGGGYGSGPMNGIEKIYIGRYGSNVAVSIDGVYISYTYSHPSLDTETLSLDIAFNGSLGSIWDVNNIQIVQPYTSVVTPEGTFPTITVGLKDNAVIGDNVVYDIPKFTINSPVVNQILQYDSNLELVNVSADEIVQDAIGSILTDSSTIDFTYNDATPTITASVIQSALTLNNMIGPLNVGKGGTNTTSQTTNGILYYNGTSLVTGSLLSFDGLTLQHVQASQSSSPTGTNNVSPLTITGGAGGAASSSTGSVTGGAAGAINLVTGNGGAITGTPATGTGGAGGAINLTAGNGGNGTTFGGAGGSVTLAGGAGGTGTGVGTSGFVSLKGGNAPVVGNGSGGAIFLVGGIPNGSGTAGDIYLGCSPSFTLRGNTGIGVTVITEKLHVGGNILAEGVLKAGSTPVTLTNVAGYILGSALVGTDITTVGTIATGTWNGSIISSTYGGTGVNNAGRTLTISVNSGTISFTNSSTTLTVANTASVSGTNTGDQTITLTGDVTGSGTGSFATTIGANKVTLGMMATLAANSIIGNNTGSATTPIALTSTQVKTLLALNNVENTALSTWAGSTNITTVGTISTGTWNGTAIADGKIASALTGKTYNGLTITSTTGTLTLTNAKTIAVTNSLTLSGTDGTTMTFPTTSATIARTDAAQTFTGTQTFSSTIAGSINGNAATATALQTARAINGVNFDGTAAITITAAAGTLTGATLASGVTASSLTSFGTSPTLVTPSITTNAIVTNNLAANTTGDAFVIQNTNTASSGNQMYSPRLRFTGQGWKTNATAASQVVDMTMHLIPLQGTSAPTARLAINRQVNGGGYAEVISFSSTGTIWTGGDVQGGSYNGLVISPTASSTLSVAVGANLTVSATADVSGTNTGDVTLSGQNYLSISGQAITANAINLSGTNVTSTLPIVRGGTNATSQTTNGVAFYNGTSITTSSALTWNGTSLVVASSIYVTKPFSTTIFIGAQPSGSYTGSGVGQDTYFGAGAGAAHTTGYQNTAVGYIAGGALTSGAANTLMGANAGAGLTTGSYNMLFGQSAGYALTTQSENVCIGDTAGRYCIGNYNMFIGRSSGLGVSTASTGNGNIGIGSTSLYLITSGSFNVGIGYSALANGQITGSYSVGIGYQAGYGITSGTRNVIIGPEAGLSLTTGSNNVFIGSQAGYSETGSNKLYIANSSTSTPLIYGDFSAGQLKLYSGASIRFEMDGTGLGFFGATPVAQPTTAIAAATFTANSGTAINDASTFDGYTLKQIVKALRNLGILT